MWLHGYQYIVKEANNKDSAEIDILNFMFMHNITFIAKEKYHPINLYNVKVMLKTTMVAE